VAPVPGRQSVAAALDEVGDRWAMLVIHALLAGPSRFSDLLDELGVAPNVLTQRLRALERSGVVVARPYSRRPPRVVYELTAAGRELEGVLRLLAQWGSRRPGTGTPADDAEPVRHAPCGTPLEARWWCPTCARPGEEEEGLAYA